VIQAGQRCAGAPFILPTNGFIGYLWDDPFKISSRHQGIDIFGGTGLNQTPVLAAYSGYLTRQADWKSSLIIRIPDDPLQPGRQIWTYYTHLADPQGISFILKEYPPGTYETFVAAGTLLGYQGNYSGDAENPVGIHLHFSIVLDNGQGKYRNELDIHNTLDPSPYLGIPLNASRDHPEIPTCKS
jgi:murein DD-endopeptidase MepM/ murein hydrolase activator NlpD